PARVHPTWHPSKNEFSSRITEGFYDTASLRSQKVSQQQSVYQKEQALPKRRCPRRGKPRLVAEAKDIANQRMPQ
ncbi:hypothetical protein, partial [Novipirellula herctigrandis]|uniref:hypothetical protein n=1 Tax=Novipirellula herctigrandis TaxID=2527986 RepID=UPI003AF3B347